MFDRLFRRTVVFGEAEMPGVKEVDWVLSVSTMPKTATNTRHTAPTRRSVRIMTGSSQAAQLECVASSITKAVVEVVVCRETVEFEGETVNNDCETKPSGGPEEDATVASSLDISPLWGGVRG